MVFTNISGKGMYLTCCHREIAPGSSFVVPWHKVNRDRAVRSAMNAGALAWESSAGDPDIPGSPPIPDPSVAEKAAAAREASRAAAAERVSRKMAEDDREVKANMARMGNFDVPVLSRRATKVEAVVREDPVTEADVIAEGDKPLSLEGIRRHNRAVRALYGKQA